MLCCAALCCAEPVYVTAYLQNSVHTKHVDVSSSCQAQGPANTVQWLVMGTMQTQALSCYTKITLMLAEAS